MQTTRQVHRALTGITLAALAASPAAQADQGDTLNFSAAETITQDSNVFPLSPATDNATVLTNSERSDTLHATSLGLTLDKQYSLQTLHAGGTLTDYRYARFGYLGFQAKDFDARWNWSFTPHLTGELTGSRSQQLVRYADYTGTSVKVRNVNTDDNYRASLDYGLKGDFHVFSATGLHRTKNMQFLVETGSYANRFGEVGLNYVTAAGNSLTYVERHWRTDWYDRVADAPRQLDTAARERDHELQLKWQPDDKISTQATLTRLERRHNLFSSRDYSGTAAKANLTWAPTAKTQLLFEYARSFGAWWLPTASFYIDNHWSLAPSWQISSKTALKMRLERSTRRFTGSLNALDFERKDSTRSSELAFTWLPRQNLTLALSWRREHRESNYSEVANSFLFDYDDTTANLSADYTF